MSICEGCDRQSKYFIMKMIYYKPSLFKKKEKKIIFKKKND